MPDAGTSYSTATGHIALLTAALCLSLVVQARDLTLEDYFAWESVTDPQCSPDGSQVIYMRRSADIMTDRFNSMLWIAPGGGGEGQPFSEGWHARWSPDGSGVGYIGMSDKGPQVFIKPLPEGGEPIQVTHMSYTPKSFSWSPDGKWIAIRAEVPAEPELKIHMPAPPEGANWTPDVEVAERFHFREGQTRFRRGYDHIFIVPVEGGKVRQITSGKWDVGGRWSGFDLGDPLQWSKDGRYIIFSANKDTEREIRPIVSTINAVDVKTGKIETLTSELGFWVAPKVSPDGSRIAYFGAEPTTNNRPDYRLYVMDVDGSNARLLSREELPAYVYALFWAADGGGVYVSPDHRGRQNVLHLDLDGRVRVVTQGKHRLSLSSVSGNCGMAILSTDTETHNVARIELDSGRIYRVTDVNADVLQYIELVAGEEIWYESEDGVLIQGWIMKPGDFDKTKKYPLLLMIHGGPQLMYGNTFIYHVQWLVAQGYVILMTNPRGSTGYGISFMNSINGSWWTLPTRDLLAGVDTVVARGYIDNDRLYVAGCSAGGALSAWLVTQTDRFAAAVSMCPITDPVSFAGTGEMSASVYSLFDKPFWEDPQTWISHSALMQVGNVSTPTLLVVGENDSRTPPGQAEQFYSALKYRGVPTALLSVKQTGHYLPARPSNMVRVYRYVDAWFKKYGRSRSRSAVSDGTGQGPFAK